MRKLANFFTQIIDTAQQFFWFGMLCCVFGYGLGKMFTYSDIKADCQVLGNFRIGMVAYGCQESKI